MFLFPLFCVKTDLLIAPFLNFHILVLPLFPRHFIMGYPDVETMSPSMRHIFKTIQHGRRGDATSPLPKIHLITGFENSVILQGF